MYIAVQWIKKHYKICCRKQKKFKKNIFFQVAEKNDHMHTPMFTDHVAVTGQRTSIRKMFR